MRRQSANVRTGFVRAHRALGALWRLWVERLRWDIGEHWRYWRYGEILGDIGEHWRWSALLALHVVTGRA